MSKQALGPDAGAAGQLQDGVGRLKGIERIGDHLRLGKPALIHLGSAVVAALAIEPLVVLGGTGTACLLEAAGGIALERCGVILEAWIDELPESGE